MVRLRLLGPVEVFSDDQVLDCGTPQQRLLLAALAADPGRPVPVETLIDRVWDDPPSGARRTLHVLVTRLRRILERAGAAGGPVTLVRRSGGYLLEIDADQVDAWRMRHLAELARDPGCPARQRLELLREAVALWQGEPLAGLAGAWAARTRQAWIQEYVATVVSWARTESRAGEPGAVLGRLSDLAGEQPLVESLAAVLMRALAAAGRPADALAHFGTVRQRLVEELGTDPSAELQAVYQAILRGEPDLAPAPVAAGPDPAAGRPVPAQLPADLAVFTGRATELAALTAALSERADLGDTVVISVIGGAGGIGKTWLALHWAHRNRHRYPDGQLFVNLRGYDPSGEPMTAEAAVRGFLDALGVPPDAVPTAPEAQFGLYRSLVAERRMLIVLDNARDAGQVAGLLPGAGGSAVIVTSRDRLTGLVVTHGAHPVPLDVLDDAQARDLLARRLGPRRLAAEPEAVAAVIAACGGLPLALGIAAARAAVAPRLALAVVAKDLDDTATRLAALEDDHPQANLRAVLSWSYTALPPERARAFALLGLAPGPDLGLPAAAALTGLPAGEIGAALRDLQHQSLIGQHRAGRWRMHDLVGLYAAECAHQDLPDRERTAAVRRLVDFSVHTAHAADRLLNPHRTPMPMAGPAPAVGGQPLADEVTAMAWLTTEHAGLLAVQRLAAAQGWYLQVWQLAWALSTFHRRGGQLFDEVLVWQLGLPAARRVGDLVVQADAQRSLGEAYALVGRHSAASEQLSQALALVERAGNVVEQARTHRALAYALEQRGDDRGALDHAGTALRLYRSLDRPAREADTLNAVGWYSARVGEHEQARTHLEAALRLAREHRIRDTEVATLDSLGYLAQHTGRYAEALDYCRQSLDLVRDVGHNYLEAQILERVGDIHAALDQPEQARHGWLRALALYRAQHRSADADRVEGRIGAGQP